MKEQELIEEGFEKVEVLMEDSGDKTDYHYYTLHLNDNFTLISEESTAVTRDRWTVSCYEIDMCFKDIEDVQTMIALYKKCSSAV
jgi:hypothetical protein